MTVNSVAIKQDEFVEAAGKGDMDRLRAMIQAGMRCDGPAGPEALRQAAANGQVNAFRLLVESGANPTAKDDQGNTLFLFAAMGGKVEILELLKVRGLSVNEVSRHGQSPLMHAVLNNRLKAARWLLDAGANVNAQAHGQFPMTALTAAFGKPKMQALLKEAGARLDPRCDRLIAKLIE